MDVIEAKERERRRGIWPFSASTGRMMGTVDGGLRQGKARQCKGMMLHACRHVPELCTLPMSFVFLDDDAIHRIEGSHRDLSKAPPSHQSATHLPTNERKECEHGKEFEMKDAGIA